MAQFTRTQSKGPKIHQPDQAGSLLDAIKTHLEQESVSWHMPGHKGRISGQLAESKPDPNQNRNLNTTGSRHSLDITEVPGTNRTVAKPPQCPQIISPRLAYFSGSEIVTTDNCLDRIAADIIAPCPPGIPLVYPGQRLTREVISCLPTKYIRVISKPAYKKGES